MQNKKPNNAAYKIDKARNYIGGILLTGLSWVLYIWVKPIYGIIALVLGLILIIFAEKIARLSFPDKK